MLEQLPARESASEFYDKYEPRQILGKGLSSIVRRCIEKKSGKVFACKMIEYLYEDDIQESTRNEIAILKRCGDHPNISLRYSLRTVGYVHLIQRPISIDYDDWSFLTVVLMECCEGGELFDYLTKMVRLSEKKARQIMRSIIDAVCHMHKKGIVHRDLKPENILMDENMNIKIADVGLSTVLPTEPNKYLHEVCGTIGYMAPEMLLQSLFPEQYQGYGREVDMWACGVILFTMLSGTPPFWHRKQHILLRQIMEANYSFSNLVWDEISTTAKEIVSRLLEIDPQKRLTAEEALAHQWFTLDVATRQGFDARRVLKAHILVVWSIIRLKSLKGKAAPITTGKELLLNPYKFKAYRRLVDFGAFDIYSHWVKKTDIQQNRAALFETELKPINELTHGIFVANDESYFGSNSGFAMAAQS
ncbi:hypothetical protein ACOME3_006640 [Neoechinorhynchus agilis]